jgi:hypothetical protein
MSPALTVGRSGIPALPLRPLPIAVTFLFLLGLGFGLSEDVQD